MAKAQALPATADSKGLQMFGFAFGAITLAVALVAGTLVSMHANGQLTRTDVGYQVVAPTKLVR
jgi:hypothetical protein